MVKVPTKSQAEIIKRHGLIPFAYVVLMEAPTFIIICRAFDGLVRYLEK